MKKTLVFVLLICTTIFNNNGFTDVQVRHLVEINNYAEENAKYMFKTEADESGKLVGVRYYQVNHETKEEVLVNQISLDSFKDNNSIDLLKVGNIKVISLIKGENFNYFTGGEIKFKYLSNYLNIFDRYDSFPLKLTLINNTLRLTKMNGQIVTKMDFWPRKIAGKTIGISKILAL